MVFKMKVIIKKCKCGVCGKENEYNCFMSNFVRGYLDFDLKPNGSMMRIGEDIMECPNCHYASYSIDKTIERRFANNLELWDNLSEFQEIIKKYSGNLRKILLVANQYKNDYNNLYKTYIMASQVSDDDEEVLKFRRKFCEIFIYKVLPDYRNGLLQIIDLLRMVKEFKIANDLLSGVKIIIDDSDTNMLDIINAEQKFINNNDSTMIIL